METHLKKALADYPANITLHVHDIRTNLFSPKEALIKNHDGETVCRHRLILLRTDESLVCGLESYEYTLKKEGENDRHIAYISKVDTTGHPTKGLTGRLVCAYITSLPPSSSIFVFARAQPQYLFAESAKNTDKGVLDDRALVSWWLSTLNDVPLACEAWWSVPGLEDSSSALIEIGARKRGWKSSEKINWHYGHSFDPQAEASAVIPRFDDDAKARLLKSVSKDKVTVSEFWELLAFGEECGSGKITGFFELRLPGKVTNEQYEKPLKHNIKNSDFTVFWNKLMSFDFSTKAKAIESTTSAKKDLEEIFPNLKSFNVTVAVSETTNNALNLSADKRPAINMLSSGFIKRKKV